MFLSDRQAKLLRIGTGVLFIVSFLVSMVVVYGYRFNFDEKSENLIVKKSLILFDQSAKDYALRLNGQAQPAIDREIRLVPGTYSLELSEPEHLPWIKTILLEEDSLVRLGQPWLLPLTVATPQIEKKKYAQNAQVFSNDAANFAITLKKNTLLLTVQNNSENVERTYTLRGFSAKTKILKVAFDSKEKRFYVLDSKNQLWQASLTDKVFEVKKRAARDLVQFEDFIGFVNDKGVLTELTSSSSPLDGYALRPPFEIASIDDVDHETSYYVLSLTAFTDSGTTQKKSHELVTILNKSGAELFVDAGHAGHSLDTLIAYIYKNELHVFDPRAEESKLSLISDSLSNVAYMRSVGTTFWRIYISEAKTLSVCDSWMENCVELSKDPVPFITSSNDGFIWSTLINGSQVTFDFDPTKTHPKTIPVILNDFIQATENSAINATSSEVE